MTEVAYNFFSTLAKSVMVHNTCLTFNKRLICIQFSPLLWQIHLKSWKTLGSPKVMELSLWRQRQSVIKYWKTIYKRYCWLKSRSLYSTANQAHWKKTPILWARPSDTKRFIWKKQRCQKWKSLFKSGKSGGHPKKILISTATIRNLIV